MDSSAEFLAGWRNRDRSGQLVVATPSLWQSSSLECRRLSLGLSIFRVIEAI